MLNSYTDFIYRRRFWVICISLILLGVCLWQTARLKLRSDFKEMLPENFQSVKDLDRILSKVGGTSNLVLAIESNDPKVSIRFARDLVQKLKEYPSDWIYRIEYNVSATQEFFKNHRYLYMKLEDLKEIYQRLKKRIDQEKLRQAGLLLELEDEDSSKVFSTEDIEKKYRNQYSQYDQYTDGYFLGENGKLLAIIVRPPGSSTGIELSKKLLDRIQQTVQELNPAHYHPSLKIGFTGRMQRVLLEYSALQEDIFSTALLCVSLISLAIYLYYRNLRMVFLMGWTAINGVLWTFALTKLHIGYLTTQTAFLGSIIVGNGINYSLILMARYLEERKLGSSPVESLRTSISATFVGTLTSAITTAVGFGVLMMTQVKGFSQFGFMGSVGMFACWLSTYTLLPAFLILSEQVFPLKNLTVRSRFDFSPMLYFSKWVEKYPKPILMVGIVSILVSIPILYRFVPEALEYDFSKLRVSMNGTKAAEETVLNDRIRSIFTSSLNPALLFVDQPEQAKPLCDEIIKRDQAQSVEPNRLIARTLSWLIGVRRDQGIKLKMVESCRTVFSFIPEDQNEKNEILLKIRKLLEGNSLKFLNDKQKTELEEFKQNFQTKTLTVHDLPEELLGHFLDNDGQVGRIVQVFPNTTLSMWDGKTLLRFADLIRSVRLPDGKVVTSSGDSVIFADLLKAILSDGVQVTAYSFIAVCLVIFITFRSRHSFLFLIGTLTLGSLWMGGVIALLKIKINFFNFIAIPTTFGIGVDYGVNLYQRYRTEDKQDIIKALRTTGGAIVLCSITTIVGYFTLIIAKHQALVSFGWIGILGELTCLAAALLFVPAFVIYLAKKKKNQ